MGLLSCNDASYGRAVEKDDGPAVDVVDIANL